MVFCKCCKSTIKPLLNPSCGKWGFRGQIERNPPHIIRNLGYLIYSSITHLIMFGDLLGNMQQKQEEMRQKLAEKTVQGEAGNGAIVVTANGIGELTNISIDRSKLDWEDHEEVEDLLMIAANRALEAAKTHEESAAQGLLSDMLPGGLGGLGF